MSASTAHSSVNFSLGNLKKVAFGTVPRCLVGYPDYQSLDSYVSIPDYLSSGSSWHKEFLSLNIIWMPSWIHQIVCLLGQPDQVGNIQFFIYFLFSFTQIKPFLISSPCSVNRGEFCNASSDLCCGFWPLLLPSQIMPPVNQDKLIAPSKYNLHTDSAVCQVSRQVARYVSYGSTYDCTLKHISTTTTYRWEHTVES